MTKPLSIPDLIKARRAEFDALVAAHDAYWKKESTELQAMADKFNAKKEAMHKQGAENQLKVTHLEGCIAELERMLPKKKK